MTGQILSWCKSAVSVGFNEATLIYTPSEDLAPSVHEGPTEGAISGAGDGNTERTRRCVYLGSDNIKEEVLQGNILHEKLACCPLRFP